MLEWHTEENYYLAQHDRHDYLIEKTYSCPPANIPAAQRWTLTITGPTIYACTTQPTRKACMEYAERFVRALPILEGRDDE